MTLDIVNVQNEKIGSIDVRDDVFGGRVKGDLVWQSVVRDNAAERRGTHATKTRAMVSGTGKKPWRQKGTGRARAGLRQSPVWRGGGVAFGPHPRSYAQKVNRKLAQLAFRRALSERILDGGLRAVESLEVADAKTKTLAALLGRLGIERGCLIVVDKPDASLARAARNLPKVAVVTAAEIGVYELIRHRTVLATRAGLDALTARLAGQAEVAA